MSEDREIALAEAVELNAGAGPLSPEEHEQRSARALLAGLPAPAPPPDLTDAVMAALPEIAASHRGWWSRFAATRTLTLRYRPAALAAAGLLLVAVGLALWRAAETEPASGPEPVTLHLVAPQARSVAVAGEFNDWRADTHMLERRSADGPWTITLELAPGRYQYVFVVDGDRWVTDPAALRYRPDGFGGRNAVLEL
jgi:hypothetical protein